MKQTSWGTNRRYEAQLLEGINESLSYIIQVDQSTNVDNKATMLVFVLIFFWGMCTGICYVHFCCQPTSWLHNYSSLWSHQENGIDHFALVYARMEWLPRLDSLLVSLIRSKRSPLTVSLHTVSSIEKRWLAEKCHLSLTMFYRMWWKLLTTLKYMPLTHVCSHSCVRRWMQSLYMSSLIHR